MAFVRNCVGPCFRYLRDKAVGGLVETPWYLDRKTMVS